MHKSNQDDFFYLEFKIDKSKTLYRKLHIVLLTKNNTLNIVKNVFTKNIKVKKSLIK